MNLQIYLEQIEQINNLISYTVLIWDVLLCLTTFLFCLIKMVTWPDIHVCSFKKTKLSAPFDPVK